MDLSTFKLLDHEETERMVDYSFGDQSGILGGVPNAYMKKANLNNLEFVDFIKETPKDILTLFIDNIRLYKRELKYSDWQHLKPISDEDRNWLDHFGDESLLDLLPWFPNKKFIIFTAFEDTPLDDYIWSQIPENVLSINAVNGVVFGRKVKPFPHGIERIMYEGYDHHELLKEAMVRSVEPLRALFVAHRTDTGDRLSIGGVFKDKPWATVTHLPYREYLSGILNHKFVLCPSGNGIESARNWETLYLRRVPIFINHPYMRELYKDYPVLFVKDYSEVTEELLKANEHLYQQAQVMDMRKLSLIYWFNKARDESF
jgi:hypothetical protein